MVVAASPGSIAELAGAAKDEPAQRDARILKQVADLFLSNVDRLRESQIGAFDGILVPLIERMDAGTLIQLSEALSKSDLAPRETVRKLAFHDDPLVAAPVLETPIVCRTRTLLKSPRPIASNICWQSPADKLSVKR